MKSTHFEMIVSKRTFVDWDMDMLLNWVWGWYWNLDLISEVSE